MFRSAFLLFILLAETIAAPTDLRGQNAAPAPTTQTTIIVQQEPEQLLDVVTNTRIGKIFQGRTKLTWDDVKDPMFWVENIRDLVWRLVEFIPRLIGTLVFLFVFWLVYRGI